ncbi:hypothetical protein GOODEAATRI_024663 [Goodea atripinnis]|uniref:Uncharacterized protein n=1 Tax=Goodea atripinnis TaxID=208336 RepID=A0ABV0Q1E8_9TELE
MWTGDKVSLWNTERTPHRHCCLFLHSGEQTPVVLFLFNLPMLNKETTSVVQVEFYVNENTFKERLKLFFIKNQRSSKSSSFGAPLQLSGN